MSGLILPKEGELAVDSHPFAELDAVQWREGVSFIEQIPAVFEGTLRENVHIGNLEASSEDVDAVLARLQLNDSAEREIATVQQLSGGELKKISLGRALLRDANLIVFDEPFEHLDDCGRQVVGEMLADPTKTRICIQHRSSSSFTAENLIKV